MITSYQFVKFREDSFVEFHRQLTEMNTISCFDFEDSIMDFKTNDSNRYKSDHREKVMRLLNKFKSKILKTWLGFRINEYGTNKYFDDIAAIKSLGDIKIRCIFLSNCSSIKVLKTFLSETEDIRYDEVIPIIESNEAFNNLEEILKLKDPRFKNIAFGHCDYNLSCNLFPFVHQDNPKYWYWIKKFEQVCKQENIGFINSLYLNVNHNNYFNLMLKNTSRFFDNWGQITLTTEQSKLCYNFKDDKILNLPEFDLIGNNSIKDFATKIITLFDKYNPEGKGYTIMPETKTFISPHEYVAAKRFVNE
ncbi:MAG: aldolase/citrate lyase family protein [Bacteroidales bacterium]|nr:aldolase/citrate lyase family protein [Bacteroidales bacterium]